MRYLFVLLLFSVFFASCGDDASVAAEQAAMKVAEAAQEKAYDTMMGAHDRVMPMMGNITATRRALKDAMNAEGVSDDRKEVLQAAFEQLDDAGDGMMKWMGEMKPLDKLREEMDGEAILAYIKEQTASIGKVETSINAAIAAGTELVGDGHMHSHDGDGHDHDHGHDHNH